MGDLITLLSAAGIGYFIGSKWRGKADITRITSVVQTAAILILIFVMGLRMGANEEVTGNLGSIGAVSAALTAVVMIFAMLAAVLCRRIIGMDHYARMTERREAAAKGAAGSQQTSVLQAADAEPAVTGKIEKLRGKAGDPASGNGFPAAIETPQRTEEKSKKKNDLLQKIMSFGIILAVAAGMLAGYFGTADMPDAELSAFDNGAGAIVSTGLIVLLFLIGMNIGFDGKVIEDFRKVGIRIVLFPVVIITLTLAGAALCTPFTGLTLRETLAVCAGFCWYTIAPGMILDAGLVHCAAVSFLHCIMREYASVLAVPFIAKKIGYMEAIGAAGGAAMGVCLPVIERSTRGDVAMYSFICGFVHTASIPVLISFFLA